ncbi:MAG: hypothetical protein ACYCW6_16940 [Candidatus Xenobia bacterium]
MQYVNNETGLVIDLGSLDEREQRFYHQALQRFQSNTPWLAFDRFAFTMGSPIYRRRQSPRDILRDPLFRALKDMSLQLGQQQGMIARKVESNA